MKSSLFALGSREDFRTTGEAARVACIIPAFKCADTLSSVVEQVLRHVHDVIVVDDGCPQGCGSIVASQFAAIPDVHVILRGRNGGVGAAVKCGIEKAINLGADIVVKVDGDGQMDPSYIPTMVQMLCSDPNICLVKGNRLTNRSVVRDMPLIRLLGNSVLSLLVKFASGYWDIVDPTNGFLAFNVHGLKRLEWRSLADSYFFETSVLCLLGIRRQRIGQVEMPAIYGSEKSSLSITRSTVEFAPRLASRIIKRILLQYFLLDVNVATIYIALGVLFCTFGVMFGAYEWIRTIQTGTARTTGTVMLAVLPILMGFQLLLNALLYDVQTSTKIIDAVSALNFPRRFYEPKNRSVDAPIEHQR